MLLPPGMPSIIVCNSVQ